MNLIYIINLFTKMDADDLADQLPDECISLFEWYEKFDTGKKSRCIERRKPRYSTEMWNLHQRMQRRQIDD